jgi:hypothetical protein
MKRKLFIGSSSEGKEIADKLKSKILEECNDWIEPKIWADKNVFTLNKSTFHNLIDAARKFEYGIFIATADDVTKKRDETSKCMRDNVLFEAGMFLGSLGLTRAFLLVDNECELPSDYNGTTVTIYDNLNIDNKINEIVTQIKDTQNSFTFNIVPATALAFGYFENFVKPLSEKHKTDFKLEILIPRNLSDIDNLIDKHLKQTKSKVYRRFLKKQRPIVFQDTTKKLWDIPTTLKVLNTVIDTFISHTEIGINSEKEEWIQHEIRNFKGTLEHLISQNCKCKNSVILKYLDEK